MIKKKDLLLDNDEIKNATNNAFENWHNTPQAKEWCRLETKCIWEDLRNEAYFKEITKTASLHTAKAIRDEIVGFGKLYRVDDKHGIFISDELYNKIFSPIKEIGDGISAKVRAGK